MVGTELQEATDPRNTLDDHLAVERHEEGHCETLEDAVVRGQRKEERASAKGCGRVPEKKSKSRIINILFAHQRIDQTDGIIFTSAGQLTTTVYVLIYSLSFSFFPRGTFSPWIDFSVLSPRTFINSMACWSETTTIPPIELNHGLLRIAWPFGYMSLEVWTTAVFLMIEAGKGNQKDKGKGAKWNDTVQGKLWGQKATISADLAKWVGRGSRQDYLVGMATKDHDVNIAGPACSTHVLLGCLFSLGLLHMHIKGSKTGERRAASRQRKFVMFITHWWSSMVLFLVHCTNAYPFATKALQKCKMEISFSITAVPKPRLGNTNSWHSAQ